MTRHKETVKTVLKLKTFPVTKLAGNLGYYETISMNGRRSNPDQRMENIFNKIIKSFP